MGFTWFQFDAPPYADSGRGHSAVSVPITSSIAQLHKSYGTWHVFTACPTNAALLLFARIAVIILIEWRDTELLPIIVIDQSCSSVRQAVLAVLCWGGHARSRHEETGFWPTFAFVFASAFTQIDNLSTLVTPQITTQQKLLPGSILVPAVAPKAYEAVL